MLQQGGEQTARPDETSFYLTFLYAKSAAAAVLALPHVAPPDATTSQGSQFGPEGIQPYWPLKCRVTASGTPPTAATLAVFGLWQCIITTSFKSSCSTGWVGTLAAANVFRDVHGLRVEKVWPFPLPCFFTGKWNANSRHQLPPGIYHFYKPPQKHRDALSHTLLTAMHPPFKERILQIAVLQGHAKTFYSFEQKADLETRC